MLFDDILEEIGEGIFQKFAIFVCGLAMLAEAVATTCVPFAMILASCDLRITLDQILGLNAALIFAMLLSGYWFGGVSDISGRKYILSTTSIITFVGCFVASFSQCVVMLYVSLFMLGIGLGGNHSATRIFIVEITPKSIRGSRYVFLELFFALGYATAIGLSRLLVPQLASSLLGNNVRLNSWRLLFGLSGSLSIFSACLMSVFPASPRWLLAKKQEVEAIDILRKIFAVNKVKHEESFPRIQLDPVLFVNTRGETHTYQCNNALVRSFRCLRIYTAYMFTKNYIKTTLACIIIAASLFEGLVVMNIWLGLALFAPNMAKCELKGASPVGVESSKLCNREALENLFKMNSYLSVCSFVLIVVFCIADKIPRKYILMTAFLVAGLAMVSFALVPFEVYRISMAFVILSFMFAAEIMCRLIIFECYPTILRCTAYGFIKGFSKLSLVFLMLFLRVPCFWAFIAIGSLFFVAGLFTLLLPNLNTAPMKD